MSDSPHKLGMYRRHPNKRVPVLYENEYDIPLHLRDQNNFSMSVSSKAKPGPTPADPPRQPIGNVVLW